MSDDLDGGVGHASGRRRQADRRAESGRGLVQAVIDIIPAQGVSAATFETIGARAGYSRSLVTQRFGSKRGLIDAVVERAHAALEDKHFSAHSDQLSGLEALLLRLDVYLTTLATSRELRTYFMLVASAVAEASELRDAFAAQHERVRERLSGLVLRGQADGSIRAGIDANSAALMIGSLELGLSMQLLVDPRMDLDPIRRTALNTVRLSFGV